MFPALLITLREVIEATLIVATILGILTKLGHKQSARIVWTATGSAVAVSVILLGLGSALGLRVQALYSGPTEEFIEGILMIVSAIFITWAVFFLHNYFAQYKTRLLGKIQDTVKGNHNKQLFVLVFTAVLREGFEIVLFLSTIYFSTNPQQVFTGFGLGLISGLIISFALFTATVRMPVFYAFRVTSMLLILFAAGLLARGVHEFAGLGLIPEVGRFTIPLLPENSTVAASFIKSIFGITKHIDLVQFYLYASYTWIMSWYVFIRRAPSAHSHD